MITPKSYEEISSIMQTGQKVFFFTASWCGDCHYIKPFMSEIEADFPQYDFLEIDRDQFLDLAIEWHILGIPSFVVLRDGAEVARLVNKDRKTKAEVEAFLQNIA
ncbi:thioredoxin family protein [Enterococcus timonensis]|uniref:thioredoxin family protein n=1 Tax=Enterococcus timonensis TaxID=1852364 RepID=UPI0008D9B711|nr:thioredoxin family protein [Enterococcus timonensis]